MQEKIQILIDLLEINKAQATDIVGRYLKSVDDIHSFLDFYFETLERENIVGTTYEKLRRVCKRAEIEFKKRFEDKEIFLEWLCNKYKNQACFRVFQGDFKYSYFANYGSNQKIKMNQESIDSLICINAFKQITYKDGDLIANGEFKEALVDFMFKNQDRIGRDLEYSLPVREIERVLTLDEMRELEKAEEKRLFNENKSRFEKILKSKIAFKRIS
ncbi:hypothetical protein ACU8C9_000084 [Campylobacter jejuni]|uniref:Uncharacterized protein n=1 Tax=Campylobacter novaezeelandiae TaxID=2267891 RepID=A0A4Q9JTK6_9BACT|nr:MULTISPECIES: hypothetical protein [Campylobacter]HEE6694171.1 hypothetical protein [Campylobacter jejuni subsp. jejuni]EAB5231431.1 hypothetical protein [Campylobacter jejuni]EAB5282931.1 hypothetical protein [Campylobacter jejuni]EAH4556336.1 hypothetical protein [Campylobacter jejuni]EAH4565030.1 hypothetical protein [Campylobacter jejuni]